MKKQLITMLVLILILLVNPFSGEAQITEVLILSGADIEDAMIRKKNGSTVERTTNYGGNTKLKIAAWSGSGKNTYWRSLIQFDLSSIPSDAVIQSAYLILKSNTSGTGSSSNTTSNDLYFKKNTSPWSEYSVTWDTRPSTTTTDQIYEPPNSNQTETLTVDIKAFVESWVSDPSSNHGIRIELANELKYRARNFASRNHATDGPIVNVTYSYVPTIESFPYNESWESTSMWYQGGSGAHDWSIDDDGTPSGNTGPSSASDGTYYNYVEASSSNNPEKEFDLLSPKFDLGSDPMVFSFDRHMYGSSMGSLTLAISEDGGATWQNLWSRTGDHGNHWYSEMVHLADFVNKTVQFRFRGITGTSYSSDMAIDNISIAEISSIQSNQTNYIVTNSVKIPGITTLNGVEALSIGDRSEQKQYFDGIGRPIQTVTTGASPSGKDIVSIMAYDEFGRESRQYLPYYRTPLTPGEFDSNWEVNQASVYSALFNDNSPFSEKKYEEGGYEEGGALGRVIEQSSPGDDWKLGSGHTVTMDYEAYSSNDDVKKWIVSNGMPVTNESYSVANVECNCEGQVNGSLYKTTTTDEDGNIVISYVDRVDRVVLKQVQVDDTPSYASTYYVYDDFGQLRFVLTPEATKEIESVGWVVNSSTLSKWAFQYEYDGRGRLVKKQVPGADPVEMVYDKWDRLALTQDGVQKLAGEWLFTKYDAFNRPIMTGTVADSPNLVADIQNNTSRFESYIGSDAGNVHGYSNTIYPIVANEADVLSVTYYDKYSFKTHLAWGTEYNTTENYETATKGLITGSLTRQLGGGMLKAISYYDEWYRPMVAITQNLLGGTDKVTTTYVNGISPLVQSTTREHVTTATSKTITESFTYDHADRLLTTTTTVDANSSTISLSYNELGQVENKILGSNVQNVSYGYNIKGWLTDINGGTGFDTPSDKFGLELVYNLNSSTGPFNGNIGQMSWKSLDPSGTNDDPQTYSFVYDKMNRLKEANYSSNGSGGFRVYGNPAYNGGIGYDLNGNILSLNRMKRIGGVEKMIDQLTYWYTGNQLTSLADAGDTTPISDPSDPSITKIEDYGFRDGATSSSEYSYDANGNMTKDDNKGITSITYNFLNLPDTVTLSNATITYTYDAAGIKLRKFVDNNTGADETTDYIGGIHYKDNVIEFMQTPDGRYLFGTQEFEYNLTDHLGNVRATVDENGDVVQRDDYYPFGLAFNSYTNSTVTQNYKYNQGTGDITFATERQPEIGIDLTKFRAYDPAIGRFWQSDPLADQEGQEVWTNYQYAYNNPIFYSDPYGDCGWCSKYLNSITNSARKYVSKKVEQAASYVARSINGAANDAIKKTTVTPYVSAKGSVTAGGRAAAELKRGSGADVNARSVVVASGNVTVDNKGVSTDGYYVKNSNVAKQSTGASGSGTAGSVGPVPISVGAGFNIEETTDSKTGQVLSTTTEMNFGSKVTGSPIGLVGTTEYTTSEAGTTASLSVAPLEFAGAIGFLIVGDFNISAGVKIEYDNREKSEQD